MKRQDTSESQVKYVYLALGSNLGNKILNLEKAKYQLTLKEINILKTSKYYQTKSWPNSQFPDFINCVILVETRLKLDILFFEIKSIEKVLGRKQNKRNYPRVCDIDIIDYNGHNTILRHLKDNIIVPHSRIHKRNFVLIPLFEINKNWIHPKYKIHIKTYISLLKNDHLTGIKII